MAEYSDNSIISLAEVRRAKQQSGERAAQSPGEYDFSEEAAGIIDLVDLIEDFESKGQHFMIF